MRPSVALRAFGTVAVTFLHVVVGGVFLLGGVMGAIYEIEHPPVVKAIFYPTLGVALLGALLLPTILPAFKQIVVFIYPYLPIPGGRRAGDPPPPAAP